MISHIDKKYFKLSVGEIKRESDTDISCNCPLCGDTKGRLHLYDSDDLYSLVYCYNSGCDLNDSAHILRNFLDIINSPYLSAYKRETMGNQVDRLKEEKSLQSILEMVKNKTGQTNQEEQNPKKEIPLHKLFTKAKDVPECVKYLKDREIEVQDDWFFSRDKYFEYNNKRVYLENYLLIPIYDEEKRYRGFYSRCIDKKDFSTFLLDGTEKIWRENPSVIPDIITEGIFDGISSGFTNPAAMLSAGISEEYRKTLPIGINGPIFALDNDETGNRKAQEYAQKGFRIFVWPDIPYKDFNELRQSGMKEDKIKQMIEDGTHLGINAIVRLKMSEK